MKRISSSDAFGLALIRQNPNPNDPLVQKIVKGLSKYSQQCAFHFLKKGAQELKKIDRKVKIKKKQFVPDNCLYKLTESELDRITFRGIISQEQHDLLIKTSKMRPPNCYATSQFRVGLNRRGTIMINSINFYGGENFNEPYHFLAEITNKTTRSVFTRFMKDNGIPVHPFNY